ncbi:MAG: hypothetical protein QHJ73_05675, partial [Armatimonadota bacterium]|nr:hypothetical protein [Armatimonadota bacterium]
MGLEWLVFRERVLGFCATGWILHGANALLLFWLGWRLFAGSARRRLLLALAAVFFFTLPVGGNLGVAAAAVKWWPAQTDLLSFGFAAASLLALDIALTRRERPRLALPLFLGGLSLLSKEMGVLLALPAALLALHRRRDPRPVLLGYLLLSATLLWVRFFAVPDALGPRWKPWHLVDKALLLLGAQPGALVSAGSLEVPLSAALAAGAGWWVCRRGAAWYWALLALGVTAVLALEAMGDTWAAIVTPAGFRCFLGCLATYGGAWVLFRCRRQVPAAFLVGCVLAANLPILHVGGVHYLYWPAAFWGLLYAAILDGAARLYVVPACWRAGRDVADGELGEGRCT